MYKHTVFISIRLELISPIGIVSHTDPSHTCICHHYLSMYDLQSERLLRHVDLSFFFSLLYLFLPFSFSLHFLLLLCHDLLSFIPFPICLLSSFFSLKEKEDVCIGRFYAFQPKGRGFESRSSRHIETLGKSFTLSCLWRFGVKLQHCIRAVSGALPSSSGLEEAL